MNLHKKQYDKEYKRIEEMFDSDKCDAVEDIFQPLEPSILTEDGEPNLWWALFNVGKIMARLVFALKIRRQ